MTEFLNLGGGLYDVRIVPFLGNAASTWLSGEYLYAVQLEVPRTIDGRSVVLRGSGLDGLSGMRPRAGAIIRPLLFTTKAAIGAYCRERQLTPRHDATNDLPEGTRNRLRLQLLPELARDYNPAVRDSLCRLAALAAADSDYLNEQAAALFAQLARRQADGWSLERAAFRALPLAMARRVLRQLVNALQGSCRGWEAQHFERLCSFIQTAETGKCLSLPGAVQAELIYDRVVFHPVRPAAGLAPVWQPRGAM